MLVIPVQAGIQAFVLFQKSTSKTSSAENDGIGSKISNKTVNSLLRTAQTTQFLRKFFSPILPVIFTDARGIRINAPLIRNISMFGN
ncbi:TPA: hypothetical protein DDX30_01235 [Candidatus Wolfebacteria bacterium]|nr:hypothetical protein [Candidatus Wolfebacteria bacterium]